jgi:hypothetical protein
VFSLASSPYIFPCASQCIPTQVPNSIPNTKVESKPHVYLPCGYPSDSCVVKLRKPIQIPDGCHVVILIQVWLESSITKV